ncbi:ras and EF-hand domain-containing protein homolog, partial [Stegodyphus dumicola]|uniref:ras and EF-hand domain-containing protein homolog n=1 Tax=Stegodyphus dumicola TaxID=202533 RepID=UPI0015A88B1B
EEYIREMWRRVQKEDPVMRSNFENFISKMAADLKDSERERTNLQSTLKCRSENHETQVQSLYAEMEEQLMQEKERILAEEQRKEQRIRDELGTELHLRDYQLQDLLQKHTQMEKQLKELNSVDTVTKYENLKLQKDKEALESRLEASERLLQNMKTQLSLLRKRSIDEKRKRAQAALKVSEGIALERENLVIELENLKKINKQLLDENDELSQSAVQLISAVSNTPQRTSPERPLEIREDTNGRLSSASNISGPTEDDENTKLEKTQRASRTMSLDRKVAQSHPLMGTDDRPRSEVQSRLGSSEGSLKSRSSEVECEVDDSYYDAGIQNNLNINPKEKYYRRTSSTRSKSRRSSQMSQRSSSIRRKSLKKKSIDQGAAPSRVFKVVFVGDSGVGKTSILQRFCLDDFKPTFSATIGVDFQVKTIEVEGERIALQLWDTAGQERFRSMTHQYFRKADGIIVVYDVTSEISFRNVRNWIHNIKEGAEEGSVIMLIGNKTDLCESEDDRVIRTKDGTRMADEFGTLFFETSAKTGNSINDAIAALASVLKTREDEAMEQVLKLQEEEGKRQKKRCC